MKKIVPSTTSEIYMQAYEQTAISTAPHLPKFCERFVDDAYFSFKRTHLENFFPSHQQFSSPH